MSNIEIEKLYTTRQASEASGRHQRTIVSWIHKGWLRASKLPGGRGQYLINPEDLEALLNHLSTPVPYQPEDSHA